MVVNQNEWTVSNRGREKSDINDLKFIFDQAEKQLKETGDISQIIVARSTTLITLISGIIISLVVFLIKEFDIPNYNYSFSFLITALLAAIYFFVLNILLALNILGTDYSVMGRMPKILFSDIFYSDELLSPNNLVLKALYISEIENYQYKISKNATVNKKRWERFNNLLKGMAISPLVLVIIYFLSRLLPLYQGISV